MFSQLLKLFPRTEFQAVVTRNHAERHARGFTCWGQFVAMLFCQLGRAHSLREICGGLQSAEGKLSHLGIRAPARATLAYANAHRPWQLYRAVFEELLGRCQGLARGRKKFRFKNKLVSLDSSVIDLCASLFDWAKFRRTKGGRQAASPARSRRLPAELRGHHRRQAGGCPRRPPVPLRGRDHRGDRPRLHGLRVVWPADR